MAMRLKLRRQNITYHLGDTLVRGSDGQSIHLDREREGGREREREQEREREREGGRERAKERGR